MKRKRSPATANLDDDATALPKRTRRANDDVLGSDTELEEQFDAHKLHAVLLPNHSDDSQDSHGGSQASQPHQSLRLMERLRLDALRDFKIDVRVSLDGLSRSAAKNKGPKHELASAEQDLRSVLLEWLDRHKASRHTDQLYYMLDNAYSEKKFPPKRFVGRDHVVVQTLTRFQSDLDLELFLATLETDSDDPAPSYLVRRLVDLQGHELASYIPIDEHNWVNLPPSPRSRGASCEVAVMLVPRDSLADLLMQHPSSLPPPGAHSPSLPQQGALEYLCARVFEPENRDRLLPVLKELCTQLSGQDKGLGHLPGNVLEDILRASVVAKDWAFLDQVVSCLRGSIPLFFFKWVADQVVSGDVALPEIEKSLLAAALTTTTLFERLLTAYFLIPLGQLQEEHADLLRELVSKSVGDSSLQASCSFDGEAVADVLFQVLGPETLESQLPAVVERAAAHTSFGLGVLNVLRGIQLKDPPSKCLTGGLFAQLAEPIVNALAVPKLFQRSSSVHKWNRKSRLCNCSGSIFSPADRSYAVDAVELANIAFELLCTGAESLWRQLVFKVVVDVELIRPDAFESLWLPFLRHLTDLLRKYPAGPFLTRHRQLFAAILETYLTRCVGPMPVAWTPVLRDVPCLCNICGRFRRFLDSSVLAASFGSLSQSATRHIRKGLMICADSYRCRFSVENNAIIVRKWEELDAACLRNWEDRMSKAESELRRLDVRPAFRGILGHDRALIMDYRSRQSVAKSCPVPIESLVEPTEASRARGARGIADHTPMTAPSSATARGCPPSTQDDTASLLPPAAARRGLPLPSPATSPPSLVEPADGYSLFASELGPRLAKLASFTSQEAVQKTIRRRWQAMTDEEQGHFNARASRLHSSVGIEGSTSASQSVHHREKLPSTFGWAPHRASVSAESGRLPDPARSRRAAAAASPLSRSSSRVLAPVPSSRLNAAPVPPGFVKAKAEVMPATSYKIKTEVSHAVVSPVNAERRVVEVIDLTGD